MTPDANDDDKTVIRPPEPEPQTPQTAFQRTEWAPGNAPPPAALEKTQVFAPPAPPAPVDDNGGHLPVGTMLAEFRLTRLIGEGGFGVVYEAVDTSLDRIVALKEYMPSSLAQRTSGSQVQVRNERYAETFEAGRKSFVNEAKLLASFDHPSLVKVYRFWEANNTAYMVMPFLKGKTLKDVLRDMKREGQVPDEAWLLSVLGPLTEALQVIHAERCYHRDIAPDNVMLLPDKNRWLLLDFGAARRVISEQTQALTVILKPGYAPVEQYAEVPGMKQGPWTDVYALAAVVYFAIVGRTPPPSVGRMLNDTYQPLSQVAAGRYSERFLAAIDRALAVRPEARTQSIGDLRQALGITGSTADIYATTPLAPSEVPSRRPDAPTLAAGAMEVDIPTAILEPAPATQAAFPQTLMTPPPAAPVAAPAPRAAAPAAPSSGKSPMVAIGVGVVALAGLGFGAYSMFAPKGSAPAPSTAPAPASAAVAPAPAAPAPAAAPAAPPAPKVFDPSQQFAAIVSAQAPGFGVQLATNTTRYRIGKDRLSFTVQAAREGFVYVFVYGADKSLVQLYPNPNASALKVKPGQVLKLPLGNERPIDTTEPPGPTELLVMVSPSPRDHAALQPKKEDTIRIFPSGAEADALLARFAGSGPILAGQAQCAGGGACDESFGAALVKVEIVR